MTHSATKADFADSVRFTSESFFVSLQNGIELELPIWWSDRLNQATPEQRNNWRLLGGGKGINWPDVDEDILIVGLLRHAWEQAAAIPGKDSRVWRQDRYEQLLKYDDYRNGQSEYGWRIDPIKPEYTEWRHMNEYLVPVGL